MNNHQQLFTSFLFNKLNFVLEAFRNNPPFFKNESTKNHNYKRTIQINKNANAYKPWFDY